MFAIPGSIFDPLSVGCHELIKEGAKLVTSTQDVLDEFSQFTSQDFSNKDQDNQLQVFIAKPTVSAVRNRYQSGSVEQLIIDALVIPMSADYLMQQIKVDLDQIQALLFNLSLDGVVYQNESGFWVLR